MSQVDVKLGDAQWKEQTELLIQTGKLLINFNHIGKRGKGHFGQLIENIYALYRCSKREKNKKSCIL